jgi:hypothetical protein
MSGGEVAQFLDVLASAIAKRVVALQRAEAERERTIYLTPEEMAERLQLSTKTLANLRSNGKGPPYVKAGSRVRYPVTEPR